MYGFVATPRIKKPVSFETGFQLIMRRTHSHTNVLNHYFTNIIFFTLENAPACSL